MNKYKVKLKRQIAFYHFMIIFGIPALAVISTFLLLSLAKFLDK